MKKEEVVQFVQQAVEGAIESFVPGGSIVTKLINSRAELERKRALKFVKSIQEALVQLGDLDEGLEHTSADELSDIFVNIGRRAACTNSEKKTSLFRAIFLNQLDPATYSAHADKYIQITDSLSESQFAILSTIKKHFSDELLLLKLYITEVDRRKHRQEHFKYRQAMEPEKIGITADDFAVEVQDLVAKGLIVDMGDYRSIRKKGLVFSLTNLGDAFVQFVLESKN